MGGGLAMSDVNGDGFLDLFVIHGISGGQSFQDVVYGVLPFFFLMLVAIAIFTIFPETITWLPSTIMDIR